MEALWRKQEKYKILQIHKMLHLLNLSRTLKNLWFSKKKKKTITAMITTTTTTTTNFIENWKITNYITFPPANSL